MGWFSGNLNNSRMSYQLQLRKLLGVRAYYITMSRYLSMLMRLLIISYVLES